MLHLNVKYVKKGKGEWFNELKWLINHICIIFSWKGETRRKGGVVPFFMYLNLGHDSAYSDG